MARYKDISPLDFMDLTGKSDKFCKGVRFVLEKLDSLPTADVVEAVRCGKCEHWKCKRKGILDDYVGDCHNDAFCSCSEYRPITQETDFCSFGKRKEQGEC